MSLATFWGQGDAAEESVSPLKLVKGISGRLLKTWHMSPVMRDTVYQYWTLQPGNLKGREREMGLVDVPTMERGSHFFNLETDLQTLTKQLV